MTLLILIMFLNPKTPFTVIESRTDRRWRFNNRGEVSIELNDLLDRPIIEIRSVKEEPLCVLI